MLGRNFAPSRRRLRFFLDFLFYLPIIRETVSKNDGQMTPSTIIKGVVEKQLLCKVHVIM